MKMDVLKQICYFCVFFAIYLHMSDGLICYSCTQCNDPFVPDPSLAKNCTGSCVKKKVELKGGQGMTRTCSRFHVKDFCHYGDVRKEYVSMCTCNGDLCNTAVELAPYKMAIVIFVIVVFLL